MPFRHGASLIRGGRYQIGIEDAPTAERCCPVSLAQFLAGPGTTLEHALHLLTLAVMFVLDPLAAILLLASVATGCRSAPMRSAVAATRY